MTLLIISYNHYTQYDELTLFDGDVSEALAWIETRAKDMFGNDCYDIYQIEAGDKIRNPECIHRIDRVDRDFLLDGQDWITRDD